MTKRGNSMDIDPAWLEAFRKDGFVHIRGVLDPDEVGRHRQVVDRAVEARKRNDSRRLDEKSLYEQSFIQCQYLWEDFPEVGRLTFHPRIAGLAAALIGAVRVRLWHDQALYKEAGGRETEAHQDHPYWPIRELDTLTAWIPLTRVDETMGCMGYVPGSHLGPAEFTDIFSANGAGKTLESRQERPPIFVPCEPGDVIFHHGLTVHMAKPNRSADLRRAYTAIYFRDGCSRAGEARHPSVDRDRIAVGAAIDGAATPIAWPLPRGEPPEPAPWPPLRSQGTAARAAALGVIPSGQRAP
jgi:hypothetical protein